MNTESRLTGRTEAGGCCRRFRNRKKTTRKAIRQSPARLPTTMPAIAPPDTLDEDLLDFAPPVDAGCVDDEVGSIVALDPAGSKAAERIA